MSETSNVIKEMGDLLAGMSAKQAGDLAAYLKDAYQIEAPSAGHRLPPIHPDPDPVVEPGTFDVILKSAGEKKIQVIKVVRAITGLGLKEAKDMVDGAPKTIKENLDKAEAEKIKKELDDQGATVELK